MKKLVLILFVLMCSISFAQGDRIMSLRQSITEELRAKTFDNLVRSSYFSLGTTEHAAPNDTTSTGTASVAYLGSEVGPLLLRIQNLGTTAKIHFKEYSTGTAGLASTTATDPYLQSSHGNYLATATAGQLAPGECWEKIYFNEPDLIFGGIEAATFSIQIFKQASE